MRPLGTGKIGWLILTLVALFPALAGASTLTVDAEDAACDDLIGVPYCTIGAAVAEAISGDTIQIGEGTYPERGITIDKNLTLEGIGTRLTVIDGQTTAPRLLTISIGKVVTIRNLTLRGGRDESSGSNVVYDNTTFVSAQLEGGGAIYNEGDLTLSFVTVDSNETVGYGGGILNVDNLTIDYSTISNNTALHGGGVKHANGLLTVTNSTFSGNTTIESGAALSIDGDADFLNCTIYDNRADVDQSDSGHAGGLAIGDFTWGIFTNTFPTDVLFVRLKNTLIAGNRDNSPHQADPPNDCRGPVISEGHNLIQTTMSCLINGIIWEPYDTDQTHDIYGQYPGYPLNIRIGPLQDNGGPTDTHALLSGSPAIDVGNSNDCPVTDQREFSRIADGDSDGISVCDIGSFEAGCGNGIVESGFGEICDDGNRDNTDTCLSTCLPATCGDAFVRIGVEECDGGNNNSDTLPDACRIDCTQSVCGDGVLDTGEACDDGNSVETDGCRSNCKVPSCGDGILDAEEMCDDGNQDSTDACLNTCIPATCGDGHVRSGIEECDDGDGNGDALPDSCRKDCTQPVCGDGALDTGEECDDGNGVDTDGCHSNCHLPFCGDGIVDSGEECDKGLSNNSDGPCTEKCLESSPKSSPNITGSNGADSFGCNLSPRSFKQ